MTVISFYIYHDLKKFLKISFKTKYSFLVDFFNDLDKFTRIQTQKEKANKKTNVCNIASELYNELLGPYFD